MRKPYFKKREKCWYVTDSRNRSKEIRLDPDEVKAHELWRQMLDGSTPVGPSASYRRLAEAFLQQNFEDRQKFKQDARQIVKFVNYIGLKKACDITKQDVVEWLSEPKPGRERKNAKGEWVEGPKIKWSQRTKKDAFDAVSRVFRWAIQEGLLTKNPVGGLKIKSGKPRSSIITPEQHRLLLQSVDPYFRRYLVACSLGPRPRQVREVEASNVLPDFSAWIFYEHKTDRDGAPLVVYLDPCMQTLTCILVKAHPTGPLFRNANGNPWKKDTVGQRIRRLRRRLGLPEDIINYAYRHTFATNALLSDVDIATVSSLLGHKDTRMVSRVYGHLDKHKQHLKDAMIKASEKMRG